MEEDFYSRYFEIEDRHWWFVGRREIFLRVLDRHLPAADGRERRILDVGCGTGTMVGHLSRYGRAEGVDASEEAVRFCHERGVESATHAAGVPLPFDDATFDLVTALDVVEHVERDDELLADLRRITRPGGMLLESVPAFQFLWGLQDEVSHHKRRYTAPQLEGRMTAAGWSRRRLSYFNTFLFAPIAAVRLVRRGTGREPQVQSDFELTPPGRLNSLLARTFAAEASLLERTDLPFGVSVLALASRD